MPDHRTIYPNLSWAQFEMFNDNRTDAFEEMCKDLFICEYLKDCYLPHSDHNNPGVEVRPILEPPREDGQPQRRISFQAKYFEGSSVVSDAKIISSLKQAVKYYSGQLDVIYLFCNKVISKETKKYKKYVDVLNPANINLELVTDKDIFVLLRKHARIANYFFQDRKRTIVGVTGLMEPMTFATSITDIKPTTDQTHTTKLLQELLKEKLEKCKEAICNLQFGELKVELELLSKVCAESSEEKLVFYKIILLSHEKKSFGELIGSLPEEMKEEAFWLKNYCKNIRNLTIGEFTEREIETQIVVLDLMFSSQMWEDIVGLYQSRDKVSQEVLKAFDLHYGLSLFNIGEHSRAHEVLNSLYEQYHELRFKLYDICSQLQKANGEYIFGVPKHEQEVKKFLRQLDEIKELDIDQIAANEPLIAALELQACFNLGVSEKQYLDEAFARYEKYSDKTKSTDGVRLFVGLCFEMAGELEKAIDLFSHCSWRMEESLASRYMTALLDLEKPETVVEVFEELTDIAKTPRIKAIYLLALYRLGQSDYKEKLKMLVDRHKESLVDIFLIGFYVEDSNIFDEIILPRLETLISEKVLETEQQEKVGLLALLSHNKKLSLLGSVLESIEDVSGINHFVIHEIYNCLFNIANDEYEAWRNNKKKRTDLVDVEIIAQRFIDADIQKRDFLQIRLLCASANHLVFSMLKYSKELYAYTHDVQTARNIISLLCEQNETKAEEYEPYLAALMESDEPGICMVAASALLKLGRYDEADYYAYKTLYFLNGNDDFEVYKFLFGYQNLSLFRMEDKPVRKSISPNMIVTLETESGTRIVALDSEDEFGDADNHSFGADHIGRTDPLYIKLIGKGRGQILNTLNGQVKIIGFETRESSIGRFIFQKVQEHQDMFKGIAWVISTDDTDEMIKQVLELSDNRERVKALVDVYLFNENDIGIPIDFFINGDYKKYIEAQQYLLYTKDLIYYAGLPSLEYAVNAKYIPAVSTLTLLASMGWLDTLNWLGDCVVIPESYMEFFKEQYALEMGTQANSAGSLVPLDNGQFTIVEPDKRIPDIWESIIVKCECYSTSMVTDEERIAFDVVEGHTWERLFANVKIDKVQLDALIVAEREKGIYFCDDLFFRKIATTKGIFNINFATLLYAYDDLDAVMPILMELSKTNYVHTPFRSRNIEEGKQLIHNLLDGEKKNLYYSYYFKAYLNVQSQIMKQYFGERWEEVLLDSSLEDTTVAE